MSQKITPNLWFDGNAKEAVDFYTKVFPKGKVVDTSHYPKNKDDLAEFQKDMAGKELTVDFELGGYRFVAINAGPEFKFNPSVSFMVNFDPSRDDDAREHLDKLWEKLIDGGEAVMPIDKYDFSERYGWVKDRYGLTWQLILTDPKGEPRPFIVLSLLFSGEVTNRAEEAIAYYTAVFKNSRRGAVARYAEKTGPAEAGSLMFADFMLEDQWFAAMDSGVEQDFEFNESVSFSIVCKNQEEIDYYWEKLSAVPDSEQCGWCKDQFGVSWQIIPEDMDELLKAPNSWQIMMSQKKIVIDEYAV